MVEETENKSDTSAALAEQEKSENNVVKEALISELDAPSKEVFADDRDVSELDKKIIRQIEFYFGDINIQRDKFMQDQMALDDGWITMDVMMNFKRLKALTEDRAVITSAIRKSTSGLMEVNEDNTKIRRSRPVPEPQVSADTDPALRARSVYAKGFPRNATLDEIIEFMEGFGPTECVFMRKFNKTMFKGSCFVTFKTEEAAQKFLAAETLKYKDAEMKKMYKHEYVAMKDAEIKERIEEKKKRQDSVKQVEQKEVEITKGALLDVGGIPKSAKREELKEFFKKFADVAWIDYETDNTKARIRFKEEGGATKAVEKATAEGTDGKILFQEAELTCSVLEGEEETKHWAEVQAIRKNSMRGGGRGRGGRRGGGRGGKRPHDGSGRRERYDRSKRAKTDAGGDSD